MIQLDKSERTIMACVHPVYESSAITAIYSYRERITNNIISEILDIISSYSDIWTSQDMIDEISNMRNAKEIKND